MHPERNKTERKSYVNVDVEKPRYVLYGVEDVPSPPVCFLFGLQQAIMCIGGTISLLYLIPGLICAEGNYELTSKLMSITLFMCGVATIFQTLFGIRLGIVQGGSNLFLLPIIAMMAADEWKCPKHSWNATHTEADQEELWESRMREIQGNLIVASITQVVLGCTGVIGILMKFVGPLTIAPTIAMIGHILIGVLIKLCNQHWGVAFLAVKLTLLAISCRSMGLTLLFSAYLANIKPPFPAWTVQRRFHIVKFPVFQLFSVILSLGVGWFFCFILTASEVFPNNSTDPNYLVRTDAKLDAVERAPWLHFPYPYQFGTPTVSSVGYVGFLVVTLVSVLESVCDYHAAARMTGASPPPAHAVNRGIAMEGIASIVSGMVASRAVFLTAGIILVASGVVGKFGAVLTIIPDPVIGGVLTVLIGMIMGSGLSALTFVELDSTRNLTVLGSSLIIALMMPDVFKDPELAAKFTTGYSNIDQIIRLLFGTSMFVGGFVGCVLDNTVPGTDKERGLLSWRKNLQEDSENIDPNYSGDIYRYPFATKFIQRVKCCSYIPVSPTFDKEITCTCCRSDSKENTSANGGYEDQVALEDDAGISMNLNSVVEKETLKKM